MSAPTRADALGSRKEGSMDSLDDWEELNPPSAPDSDDEREPLAFQHAGHKSSGMCVEPRRASSPAAPETPTRFSAGSFARVDSSSNSNVADDFEDLDAGVISRFPPRHSASYEQRPGPGMGNDHDHPSGVDQWLKLAEESLTAGASRAASDLVALLAAVKRGSTAKARLPGEDDRRLAGENLADNDAPGGIFSRELSAGVENRDDWRALVRSLGPARFFLPAAVAAVAVIVILACAAFGAATGTRGTAGRSASIAAPTQLCVVDTTSGATQLARRLQPDCPARLDGPGDDPERELPTTSMPELPARDDDDDAQLCRDAKCAVSLLGSQAENDRLQTAVSSALGTVAELEARLAEAIAFGERLRRELDEQTSEKSVWKRSSERWYDAYQREREERALRRAAKSSWTLNQLRGTTALARRALGHVARFERDA